MTKMIFVFPF